MRSWPRRRGGLASAACGAASLGLVFGLGSFGLVWLAPSPCRAFDVGVDTDTSFQIYEVRSPGARAFMARRRLLSRLALRLSHDLEEPDDDGNVLRITVDAQLRLEQDFGETCLLDRELCVNAVDADDPGAWQPLASDTRLDVPAVWAELSGLPLGGAAKLGRQLLLDRIGFARFDGLSVRVLPVRGLRVDAHAGLVVRGTSLGGTSRSDPPGSIRLEEEAARVPWAAPPVDTWVAGGAVEGAAGRWLTLRLGYRHMWEIDGDVVSRVAATGSSVPVSWLRLEAGAVYDVLTDEVIDVGGRVAVGEGDFIVRAGVERRVPRFDPGTIWAWFALAPISQVDLGATWRVTPDLSLGASLRGRRAELGDDGEDLDAGLDGWFRARWEGFSFGASGFGWTGSLGPLAGVSLDVARPLFGWLELALAVSIWHFDDPNRQDNYGTVVSEALTGTFRLSPETVVLAEVQHATSQVVGHRFRGILALRVDTWR